MTITYLSTYPSKSEAIAAANDLICQWIVQEQDSGWLVFQVQF